MQTQEDQYLARRLAETKLLQGVSQGLTLHRN